ncbi:MAG TPA: 50S ribosomal protein L11 methyltransferase [Chthoniobacterales bacterium]|nr:50S ribosomal protein L11 methyltransferase [Chthoniobacterales bacterium]
MYLWRKQAHPNWLRSHEQSLQLRFGSALAIVERPGKARTLVEISCRMRKEAIELQKKLGGSIEKLRTDWLQRFAKRSTVKPVRIGSRSITIPAEAAFGTGEHATTAMCVRLLERVAQRRDSDTWTMLDAGTGTGILAIVGSCLGAKRVLAIDNDPLACSIARRNARKNRANRIEFRTADVLKVKLAGKLDIITANLFSELLIAAMPGWSPHLAPEGCLILSGILTTQETSVVRALRRQGFTCSETRRRGKWVALLAERDRQKGS